MCLCVTFAGDMGDLLYKSEWIVPQRGAKIRGYLRHRIRGGDFGFRDRPLRYKSGEKDWAGDGLREGSSVVKTMVSKAVIAGSTPALLEVR